MKSGGPAVVADRKSFFSGGANLEGGGVVDRLTKSAID
jgi:hypothetical protein